MGLRWEPYRKENHRLLGRWAIPLFRPAGGNRLEEGEFALEAWRIESKDDPQDVLVVSVATSQVLDWMGYNLYGACELGYIQFLDMEYACKRYFELAETAVNAVDRSKDLVLYVQLLSLDGLSVLVSDRVMTRHRDKGFGMVSVNYSYYGDEPPVIRDMAEHSWDVFYVLREDVIRLASTVSKDVVQFDCPE
jgi:hypothetical protein